MIDSQQKTELIKAYVTAYNNFDIDGMLKNLHQEVVFKNISNGEVNMSIEGIEAFKAQAEQAKTYFSSRAQKITKITPQEDTIELEIDYQAVLAADLPNGMKKGEELSLKGKAVFGFKEGKIVEIQDIS